MAVYEITTDSGAVYEVTTEAEASAGSDWSLGNEAAAVRNRAVEGGSDLLGFLDAANRNLNPMQMGGPRFFGLNENIYNSPAEGLGDQLKEGAKSIGLLGNEKAQTLLGNIAGEVAYNAPSMFLPGGFTKPALMATGLGGTAAGIVRNEGGTEGEQAIANLGGSLAPSIWQGGKSLFKAIGGGDALEDAGMAMQRKSTGARASDYQKTAKNANIYDVADNEVQAFTEKVLNNVIESGDLGTSRNPKKMLANALKKESEVIGEIGKVVKAADAAQKGPIVPTFDRAIKYVTEGNVPADQIESYLKDIEKLSTALDEKGAGKLSFLQKQKVTYGKMYEEGNEIKNGFTQALYHDLKGTLEQHVPGIRDLNKQEQKWLIVNPILKRNLGLDAAQSLDAATLQKMRTSGGVGSLFAPLAAVTTAGGVAAGGVAAGAPLVALGGATLLATTPRGKSAIGGLFNRTGKAVNASMFTPSTGAISGMQRFSSETDERAQTQSTPPQLNLQYPSPNSAPKPSTTQAPIDAAFNQLNSQAKQEVSMSGDVDLDRIVDQLEPALVKYESAGNPKAQSKENDYMKAKGTGTAKGLWQLLDSTGKEWHKRLKLDGEYDPYNAEQNATIGRAYLKSLLNHYEGDYELALTAYHTGMGTVDKLLDKTGGSKLADIKDKLGPEGRKYAAQVLKRLPKPIAVKA